jgi:hypothetical protein
VTPADANITSGTNNFGASGHPVVHPTQPNKAYIGYDGQGIWESTDYGKTFTNVSGTTNLEGSIWFLAMAPDASYMIAGHGHDTTNGRHLKVIKSTDLGRTWFEGSGDLGFQPYGCDIDPSDVSRAIFTSHAPDDDGVYLSTNMHLNNGSITAANIGDNGTGATSPYAYFGLTADTVICNTDGDTTAANGTRRNTFNGSVWSGWSGVDSQRHFHGNHQLFADRGSSVLYNPGPGGIMRSTDDGETWAQVSATTSAALVRIGNFWMAGRGYALGPGGSFDPELQDSTDGTSWTDRSTPSGMDNGPRGMCATTNAAGQRVILVNCWCTGTWRYVVP